MNNLGLIVPKQKAESIYIERVNLRELSTLRGNKSVIILKLTYMYITNARIQKALSEGVKLWRVVLILFY